MTYRVEILCVDRDAPRARDAKAPCASRSAPPPSGENDNIDTASSAARNAARLEGWERIYTTRGRTSLGWICSNCKARRL